MVKGPENKAYSMLDYDINAAQSVNVVHRYSETWKINYVDVDQITDH
jgi:hypothetical protein